MSNYYAMGKLPILHIQSFISIQFDIFLAAHKFDSLWAFLCPVFLKSLTGQQLQAKNLKVSMSTNANPGNDHQSRQPGHTAIRELSPVFS
jgi:hypothetical protein